MDVQRIEIGNTCRLQIWGGGFAQLDPQWKLPDFQDPVTRLYYMKEGEAWVTYGGQTVRMRAGNLCVIPADLLFSAGCEASAEKIFFHINLLMPDGRDPLAEWKEVLCVPYERQRYERLELLCRESGWGADLALQQWVLEDLITLLKAHPLSVKQSVYSPAVWTAICYMREHLSLGLTVEELASRIPCSARMLTQRFRKETGKTVGQYLDSLLWAEAKRRLLMSDASLGEISEELGFCDQFYFSRRFRQLFGVTPSYYRAYGKLEESVIRS